MYMPVSAYKACCLAHRSDWAIQQAEKVGHYADSANAVDLRT